MNMIRWYKKKSANFDANFKILKKCGGKLECLILEKEKKESGPNSILNRTPSFRDSLFNSGHSPFTRFNFNARLPHFMYIGNHFNFLAIDNGDMKPSKRQEYFVSSISVLKLVYLNFSLWLYYFYNSFKSLNWRGSTRHNCTTSLLFFVEIGHLKEDMSLFPL